MSVIADPARLANLWNRIRAMIERARVDIGAFDPLAALSRARRLAIARWIALIETIVRKVLFVEAAALLVLERAAQQPYNGPQLTIIPLRTFALASHGAPRGPAGATPLPLEGGGAGVGVGVTETTLPSLLRSRDADPRRLYLHVVHHHHLTR